MSRYITILAGYLGIVSLWACAQIAQLEGGPKDEQPPSILWDVSTPNEQVNVRPKKLEFTFDEWVKVASKGRGIVISPPLDEKPAIRLRRRTLEILFHEDEVLRDDKTYIIQFNNQIVDLTEGNPLSSKTFVFSTGDYIDSLRLDGRVDYLWSEDEDLEGMDVWLIDTLLDTPLAYQEPYYMTRTDTLGNFSFTYLQEGEFYLVAFDDRDNSGSYAAQSEPFGFLLDRVSTSVGRISEPIHLYMASEKFNIKLFDTTATDRMTLQFNLPVGDLEIAYDGAFDSEVVMDDGSTVILYPRDTVFPKRIYLNRPSAHFVDTLVVNSLEGKTSRRIELDYSPTKNNFLLESDSVKLEFSTRICHLDPNLLTLKRVGTDKNILSLPAHDDSCTSTITAGLRETRLMDSVYRLLILPGALGNIWNEENEDTLRYDFVFSPIEDDGEPTALHVVVQGLDTSKAYVVVLKKTGIEKEIARTAITDESTRRIVYNPLDAGEYLIYVVEDRNRDGVWTAGSFEYKELPEAVYKFAPPVVRQGWITEFQIRL